METSRKRWEGHVPRMEGNINAYRDLVGNPKGKKQLGRARHRWDGNINKGVKEVDYIQLAEERDNWQAVVNAVINLPVQ
jgi:hypothetical protein